jgi:hypothetical protein
MDRRLPREVACTGIGGCVRTLGEALEFINRELPKERRRAPAWRRAREMLARALRSKDPAAVEQATKDLERAITIERKPHGHTRHSTHQ